MTRATLPLLILVFATACGSSRPAGVSPTVGASGTDLASRSGVACHDETECAICYRRETCGEAIGASDPQAATEVCHVSPAAFCMPRRVHCDEGHCVAR